MTKSIEPVEQQTVPFYGDDLIAVRADDGNIYVSVRQMCHALGIDVQGQTQRIRRNDILADGEGVCKLHTPSGGTQTAIVLRVDLVPMWLSGIRTKSVNEDARPKLVLFQKNAARVLWEAFQRGELTTSDAADTELSPAQQALALAKAVYEMAQAQVRIESRLDSAETRLELIEANLGNDARYVTNSQATQISQAVKAIALELGKRSGRNEFGGVYGEIYRRFKVPEYQKLPATQFEECMEFLRQWYETLTDDSGVAF